MEFLKEAERKEAQKEAFPNQLLVALLRSVGEESDEKQ